MEVSLLLGLLSCGSSTKVSLEPTTSPGECLLLRQNGSGVLGMDVGSSLSLGDGTSLFIFGDTFFGHWNADGSRAIQGAVHSSTAVVQDSAASDCFAGSAFVSEVGGAVAQLLDPTQDEAWPIGPVLSDSGTMNLLYTWVRSDPGAGLGFDTLGNGIVAGPIGGSAISVDVNALSAPASEAMPAAWLVRQGYAYLYRCGPELGAGTYPCVVGRAPASALGTLSAYQYYVGSAGYVGTYQQALVVTQGAPALSVTWNANLSAYLAIWISPFARSVSAATAPSPEGPFSAPVAVWPCSLPADDPDSYCYAAFEHPELEPVDGRTVAITYSTNSTSFASMTSHPNLYWPRLVEVDLTDAGL